MKPDVTKYESLEYWDSQRQIELYPERWEKKTNYLDGKATVKQEELKSTSAQLKMSFT